MLGSGAPELNKFNKDQYSAFFEEIKCWRLAHPQPQHKFAGSGVNWHERAAFQSVGIRAVDWQRR